MIPPEPGRRRRPGQMSGQRQAMRGAPGEWRKAKISWVRPATMPMPTPMPTWDGVGYVPSYALPTFRTGDLDAAEAAADDPDFGGL